MQEEAYWAFHDNKSGRFWVPSVKEVGETDKEIIGARRGTVAPAAGFTEIVTVFDALPPLPVQVIKY